MPEEGPVRADLAVQMAFATGYHHRRCSPRELGLALGVNNYREWPNWRDPDYLFSGGHVLSSIERYYLYHDTVGPFVFVFALLKKGLLYGNVRNVDASATFPRLITHLLDGGRTGLNCVRFREQRDYVPDRRLCRYRRCRRPSEHHTIVCPDLHARCSRCRCRGHTSEQRCDPSNPAVMSRLRADFEDAADEGWHTRRRLKQLAWGWYPYALGATHDVKGELPPPVAYNALTARPVEAMVLLQSVVALPQHQGHQPPPLLTDEQVAAAKALAGRELAKTVDRIAGNEAREEQEKKND